MSTNKSRTCIWLQIQYCSWLLYCEIWAFHSLISEDSGVLNPYHSVSGFARAFFLEPLNLEIKGITFLRNGRNHLPNERASDPQNDTFTYLFPFARIKRKFLSKLREVYSRVKAAKPLLFMVSAITSVIAVKQQFTERSWNSLILMIDYVLFCRVMA